MENISDIKSQLDKLYKQYKNKKSVLNVTQTNDVVSLLKRLSQNGDAKDVAVRLVDFSEKVCSLYFDELTSGSIVPLDIVESIINSFISVNSDTSKERFYVKKYATMVVKVINNYAEASYESKTIAKLTALVAFIGLKSDENKSQFERIILETKGKIYLVDYSSISEKSLANALRLMPKVYPDVSFEELESRRKDKLMNEVERMKIDFSEYDDYTMTLGEGSRPVDIDYDTFSDIITPLITENVLNSILKIMEKANVSPENIDAVILAGGSSGLRPFADIILSLFGEDKIICCIPLLTYLSGKYLMCVDIVLPQYERKYTARSATRMKLRCM